MNPVAVFALTAVIVASHIAPAAADPFSCHKKIVAQLLKLKKLHGKSWVKCLDKENLGKLPGPCLDEKSALKLASARAKVQDGIAASCSMADLAALGFGSDCQLRPATSDAEAACAALPVSSASELAACLSCWKEAELSAYAATLYASHALEVCGGALDATSDACAALDCTTPLPDQRNLGDTGENDCQRGIGKAGTKHLLVVEKTLEKCGLLGSTRAECLADEKVMTTLDKARGKLETLVRKKCGNRSPAASTPFCCRTGGGNACMAATTRDECTLGGGDVQENKVCGVGDTCDPVGGGQKLTWWEICPISDGCGGPTLATLEDLIDCVDATVGEATDDLACIQLPGGGWPCGSPSGAFLAD